MTGARYFNRVVGQYAKQSIDPVMSPGTFIVGLRSHSHLGGTTQVYDDAIVYTCTDCDAFAWKPRP